MYGVSPFHPLAKPEELVRWDARRWRFCCKLGCTKPAGTPSLRCSEHA